MKKIVFSLGIITLFSFSIYACTTMLATKGATKDSSVFVAHSDDDELGDQRIIYVPAMDHAPGSKRPVYYDAVSLGPLKGYGDIYPRYVGKSRGPGYDSPGYPATQPLGYIDQVAHTYAYIDANYGIMNEHQLMIGECTNGAKFETQAKPGERIFYSSELSRVALERCTTARDAVKLMGELIETYGYYGTGETLLVGDVDEGWVFEMCATPDKYSDLWVAKKVPDGEFFVAANEFRIREIPTKDPDILFCKHLFDVAEKLGWWKPEDGPLDWLKTVSFGEYNHPYYSLRRVWSVLRRVSPSSDFSPWVEDGYTKAYPLSVKPDEKLSVQDIIALYRDHYEGTEFSLRKGIAAGPFGFPARWIGPYDGDQNNVTSGKKPWGAWERPLSIFYSGYGYVLQGRKWLPDAIGGVAWIGLDASYTNCYMPFYVGVDTLPQSFQTGSTAVYNRATAWWAFNFVANWAQIRYDDIIKDIQSKQQELESKEFAMQPAVEQAAVTLHEKDPGLANEYLSNYCKANVERVLEAWWVLADMLIVKYDDGYVNVPVEASEVGYPKWWLDAVGYKDGPITYKKPDVMQSTITDVPQESVEHKKN